MRYRIDLEYDGTNYSGWQKQGDGFSIQEAVEESIYNLSGERVFLFGSGRTDAGVHALNQVAHFDLIEKHFDPETITKALNYYLYKKNRDKAIFLKKIMKGNNVQIFHNCNMYYEQDIAIKKCTIVSDDFHARFSSKMRHYKYVIFNSESPSAIFRNRAWHIINRLDEKSMQKSCELLIGLHDFSSFRDSECQAKTPIKTINYCNTTREDDLVIFDISAKSFLHHMIRNIIGTLKDVGLGKMTVDDFKRVIEAKDRKAAGMNAPAYGLYFVNVDY